MKDFNPFRYRGYYYDVETSLYYLQSRYYDPAMGRFLNADNYVNANGDMIGFNRFLYCSNNPIMLSDPSGHFAISTFLIISAVTLIVGGAAYGGISAAANGGNAEDIFTGIGKGALNGAILTGGIALAIGGFYIGPATLLGSMMVTYGGSITANMLEVAVTQGKKSYDDGDGFWSGATDVNDAMFANSGGIVVGIFTLDGTTIMGTRLLPKLGNLNANIGQVYLASQEMKFSKAFISATNSFWTAKAGPISLAIGYGLAGYQLHHLANAIVHTPDFEKSKWVLY